MKGMDFREILASKPRGLKPKKCNCKNYQWKCYGLFIKSERGQKTCLWSHLNCDELEQIHAD